MTAPSIRELFIRELTMDPEKLKTAHPTIWRAQAEFIDYEEGGRLTLAFPVRPDQRNGYQLLQGGVLSSFFDDAFGIFVFITSGHSPFSTINMTVNYHRAVKEDTDRVIVNASVLKAGRQVVSMEARAEDPKGRLIATCQSNLLNAEHAELNL